MPLMRFGKPSKTFLFPYFSKSLLEEASSLLSVRSRREEMNLQPAIYKLDSAQSDTTHAELTQDKTDKLEEPSS